VIRVFKYPLQPTKAQEVILDGWLAACCELYNAALEERRDAWRKQRVSISRYDQNKELTGLREADRFWRDVPVWVERSALSRLEKSFAGFFRRIEAGQASGFPRFRSRDRYNTFDLESNIPRIGDGCVRLPKIGDVKFHEYRKVRGRVRQVRVSRRSGGWSISFVCDLGDAPMKIPVRNVIGIDMGLETFMCLSDGTSIENPRFFRASEKALARRQRALSRKHRGSHGRQEAKRLVARMHERIRNQRLDRARKLACDVFSRFDLVVHEDLAISRMVHGNLAKSICDAAWGVFLRCLALKAEEAGKHVVAVDPRGTSQACAACGTVVSKTLDERRHRCPSCGFEAHRDHNAALVILGRGLRPGQLTEAAVTYQGMVVEPTIRGPFCGEKGEVCDV
jgi:putative transposase